MADLSHVDLLELIGADVRLRRKSAASGEWMGACPVCGGRDRFTVWPSPSKGKPRYWCRQCGAKGDAADYLVWRGRAATMGEALKMLGSEYTGAARSEPRPIEPPATAEPPPVAWQERARSFADYAGRVLWSRDGVEGLEMLRRRGLKDDTIRAAGLGYNPKELHDDPRRWGLEADHKPVWLPVGVVIPYTVDGELWLVKIRQLERTPRYVGVSGGTFQTLYNADALQPGRPAVLCEGELDALAVQQAAGNLAAAVATGTTGGAHRVKWLARLGLAEPVLIALDNDAAGNEAAPYWLDALGERAKRWPPLRKDPGEVLQADGPAALMAWVKAGLEGYTAAAEQVLLSDPAPVGDLPQLADLADLGDLGDVCECGAPVDRYLPTGQPVCAACYAQALAATEAP